MPVTVSWDDDAHTITCVTFEGKFNFEDIFAAWEQEIDLFHSVTHPVYSINVFGRVPLTVKGLSVRKLQAFARAVPAANLQMTVQVSSNPLARHFLTALNLQLPADLYVVATLDEAYALIEAHRKRPTEAITSEAGPTA